jgi:hypothetical protein
MNRRTVGGSAGSHQLGYGFVQDGEVAGSALTGNVRIKSGSTLLGSLAAGAAVGTKLQLGQDCPKGAPLFIEFDNAADRVSALAAGFRAW